MKRSDIAYLVMKTFYDKHGHEFLKSDNISAITLHIDDAKRFTYQRAISLASKLESRANPNEFWTVTLAPEHLYPTTSKSTWI